MTANLFIFFVDPRTQWNKCCAFIWINKNVKIAELTTIIMRIGIRIRVLIWSTFDQNNAINPRAKHGQWKCCFLRERKKRRRQQKEQKNDYALPQIWKKWQKRANTNNEKKKTVEWTTSQIYPDAVDAHWWERLCCDVLLYGKGTVDCAVCVFAKSCHSADFQCHPVVWNTNNANDDGCANDDNNDDAKIEKKMHFVSAYFECSLQCPKRMKMTNICVCGNGGGRYVCAMCMARRECRTVLSLWKRSEILMSRAHSKVFRPI